MMVMSKRDANLECIRSTKKLWIAFLRGATSMP